MIETEMTPISAGTSISPGAGIPESFDRPAIENPPHPGATALPPAKSQPQSVRIAKRSSVRPWTIPRRLDPATIGSRLIISKKTRGLFQRAWMPYFRASAAKARRAAEAPPAPRKPRRWMPVVIWPVFPRGPLELPALGVLHKAKRCSIKTCRARPVRRNRFQRPDQVA
jgi:hypothetical protein